MYRHFPTDAYTQESLSASPSRWLCYNTDTTHKLLQRATNVLLVTVGIIDCQNFG